MKEETKEILYNLKMYVNDKYLLEDAIENKEQAKILLDYITNLQEENKHLDEVNCHLRKKINNDDFDETMKDIKDNLIARINRQECEIHNLQQRIDRAIAYIECGKIFDDIETARIIDKYEKILLEILKGSDKECTMK